MAVQGRGGLAGTTFDVDLRTEKLPFTLPSWPMLLAASACFYLAFSSYLSPTTYHAHTGYEYTITQRHQNLAVPKRLQRSHTKHAFHTRSGCCDSV